jgi:hypothetical protein
MEALLGDTSDVVNAVMFNTEHEANIIDEANVVREIRSSQSRTAMGYEKPVMKIAMVDINDVVMSNMEDEADIIDATSPNPVYEAGIQGYQGREPNMNNKHKTRDVKADISDTVVSKHGTQVEHQGPLRQRVQEARDEGWDAQGQPQGQVCREDLR